MEVNASALAAFESILNQQAVVRDYLIAFSTNLPINSPNSIALQASTLAQFTAATNQLTRNTAVSSSNPSNSHTLDDPLSDARIITMPTTRSCPSILCHQNLIRRCATGSDAYLSVCHQRSQRNALHRVLRVHRTALFIRRSMGPCNKEALPSAWMARGRMPFPPTMTLIWSPSGPILVSSPTDTQQPSLRTRALTDLFADGTDFSWQAIQKGRNAHYQRQAVREHDILHHHRTPLLCRTRPKLSPAKWPTRSPSSARH